MMLQILGISLLSGMSTPLGGWLVLSFPRLSTKWLSFILGMAAGIMMAVVIMDLMPAAIRSAGPGTFFLGATIGWVFMELTRQVMKIVKHQSENPSGVSSSHDADINTNQNTATNHTHPSLSPFYNIGWFITIAMALHDLPEGIAIGAGDAIHRDIGTIIAIAIAIHNIPEGMGIAAPLRLAGVPKLRIFLITFLTGLVTPIGTLLSLMLLDISTRFVALSLAFAAGAMLYVVAQNILPVSLTQNWPHTVVGSAIGCSIMVVVSSL